MTRMTIELAFLSQPIYLLSLLLLYSLILTCTIYCFIVDIVSIVLLCLLFYCSFCIYRLFMFIISIVGIFIFVPIGLSVHPIVLLLVIISCIVSEFRHFEELPAVCL